MPIVVEKDDRLRRLTARATGALTPADVFDFVRKNRSGDLSRYQLLFDATGATLRARPQDVQILAERVARDAAQLGGVRGGVAIVASENLIDLARSYEALCEGAGLHIIRVFRDLTEAERWLGW